MTAPTDHDELRTLLLPALHPAAHRGNWCLTSALEICVDSTIDAMVERDVDRPREISFELGLRKPEFACVGHSDNSARWELHGDDPVADVRAVGLAILKLADLFEQQERERAVLRARSEHGSHED